MQKDYALSIWESMNLDTPFPFNKDHITQAEFMSVVESTRSKKITRSYLKNNKKYSSIEEKLKL